MTVLVDQRAPYDAARVAAGDAEGDLGNAVSASAQRFSTWELVPVGLLSVFVPFVFFGMWPLSRPVVYTQDAFQHLALARTADWTGTPGFTTALSAPHGIDWQTSLPTGTERIHVVVLRLFDWLTGDVFVAMNLMVLLGVATTIVVSYLVIRWLGADRVVATGAAVAFAMSPLLTDRLGAGHLFLFALYPVALGVYLAVLGSRQWAGTGWRPLVVPVVAIGVVATSSIYYATFSAIVISVIGVVAAVRSADRRRLRVPFAIVGTLLFTVILTLIPDLMARRGSSTAGAFTRSVADNDRYGLRLSQMLLPLPDSRLPFLARLGDRAYWVDGIGDYGVNIGLIGLVGLLVVGWVVVRRVGRPRDRTDEQLSRLAVVVAGAAVFATVGGLGFLLATFGFTQTRVWSRLASFIGFAAIAGLALVVTRRWGGRPRLGVWVCAVVALSLLEHPLVPGSSAVDEAFAADRAVAASLESALPAGASVAELPSVPFPDDVGSDRLLAPSLHAGDRLRFSAAGFKGSAADWQQTWLNGDVASSEVAAAAAGFDALLLQRSHHLLADGDAAVRQMEVTSGEPAWRSADGSWAWVDLRPERERLRLELGDGRLAELRHGILRPIGVTYGDWLGATWRERSAIQLLGEDGAIRLHTLDDDRSPIVVSFDVGAADGTEVVVTAPGVESIRVDPGPDGRRVTIRLENVSPLTSVGVHGIGDDKRFDRATPSRVWVGDVQVRDADAHSLFDSLR
ncbi:MAG TPA: hypothetical protein PLS63_09560 [Microthrixaceae bacterium]|nr:hypothetical protein [Microthrixaceae bacterium]